jgi:hypothetical protein
MVREMMAGIIRVYFIFEFSIVIVFFGIEGEEGGVP